LVTSGASFLCVRGEEDEPFSHLCQQVEAFPVQSQSPLAWSKNLLLFVIFFIIYGDPYFEMYLIPYLDSWGSLSFICFHLKGYFRGVQKSVVDLGCFTVSRIPFFPITYQGFVFGFATVLERSNIIFYFQNNFFYVHLVLKGFTKS
jgi:hypothetical protein